MSVATKNSGNPAETRQALLAAAGAVFAEHGYRNTTVREICRRAGANIAAINYHFGDKQRLYLEVLRQSHDRALEKYPPDLGVKKTAAAGERLRAFIRSFLLRIFDVGPTAWHGKLTTMEMINPTSALDTLVDERFRPMAEQLTRIIKELAGSKASPDFLRRCAASVVSQCVFYQHCRPVISRLYPAQRFEPSDIEELADHISSFSLAAIQQLAAEGHRPKK